MEVTFTSVIRLIGQKFKLLGTLIELVLNLVHVQFSTSETL